MRLGDRHSLRLTVDSGARREDELLHATGAHRLQQQHGVCEVVLVILAGIRQGFADLDERSEMHNRRHPMLNEQVTD